MKKHKFFVHFSPFLFSPPFSFLSYGSLSIPQYAPVCPSMPQYAPVCPIFLFYFNQKKLAVGLLTTFKNLSV